MTREEAIEELQSMCDHLHAHGICDKDSNMLTACKMAISALEQPCEAVSREDALKSLIDNTDFEGWELSQALEAIEKLPPVTQKSGKCKNCKYFEYDSVAKVDGIPLIVAHEICNKWGDGCKTSEDGYCYLFEPQESEEV